MKKLVAVFLVLVMAVNLCGMACASTEYSSYIIKNLDYTVSEWLASETMREFCGGIILLDYMLVSDTDGEFLYQLSSSGYGYIAKYGSAIDLYIRKTDGSYLNLFYTPGNGKITDYGTVYSKPSNSNYTYYSIDMDDVIDRFGDAVDILNNNT